MRDWCIKWTRGAVLLLTAATAAPGAGRIVLVADSRLFSGWRAWWCNLYNDSLFWFAVLTIVILPALGLAMSKVTDAIMKRIGINLKSRVPTEH